MLKSIYLLDHDLVLRYKAARKAFADIDRNTAILNFVQLIWNSKLIVRMSYLLFKKLYKEYSLELFYMINCNLITNMTQSFVFEKRALSCFM